MSCLLHISADVVSVSATIRHFSSAFHLFLAIAYVYKPDSKCLCCGSVSL